ncbi:hypothetical protein QCA50_018443 [Cerrena zonata]|uniref:Uncharacterized protein n=1 Tax=Cerrena zonata TaxID=2478898 RepID=A0AAW0FMN1_9APHY
MTTVPPVNLSNVQGDILAGIPKKFETTIFFNINNDVAAFRKHLTQVVPLITTTTQAKGTRDSILQHKQNAAAQGVQAALLPVVGVTLGFSQLGLKKIGINDSIGDPVFEQGQLKDAQHLGDKGTITNGQFTPDWLPAFKNGVHGVFVIAGDSIITIEAKIAEIKLKLGLTITEVFRSTGNVRPGPEKGHEHFGFLDGISNPAVKDFDTNPLPGQGTPVRPGIILLGREADPNLAARPSWAVEGSFLAFRYLSQLVPEFDQFLKKNPIPLPGLTPEQGSEFLGARLVGRWKSGAPLDLAPLKDDPILAADPQRNNDFDYSFPEDLQTQDRCPFAAHVRKTNPRNDLQNNTETRRIIRRGIPFGPEVTPSEAQQGKTTHDRGLLFRCYQSVLANGFQFIQVSWANNTGFPFGKPADQVPGFDPIIGQAADPASRIMGGTNPQNATANLGLPAEWVVSKGGEYFFAPSISALKTTFATA